MYFKHFMDFFPSYSFETLHAIFMNMAGNQWNISKTGWCNLVPNIGEIKKVLIAIVIKKIFLKKKRQIII